MPTYTSPSSSRSNSNSSSYKSSRGRNSSRQYSRSRSPSGSRSSSPAPGVKGTLFFLGSIAAATFLSHKFWPKGIIFGSKEEWEEEKHLAKKAAKAAASDSEDDDSNLQDRDRGRDRESGAAVPYADREERRARYREGGAEYLRRERGDYGHSGSAPGSGSRSRNGRGDSAQSSRQRSRDRDRDREADRYSQSGATPTRRRSLSQDRSVPLLAERVERQRGSYYPPAPRRTRYYYQEDSQSDPGDVYQEVPSRSRRASADGRRLRRQDIYGGDYR